MRLDHTSLATAIALLIAATTTIGARASSAAEAGLYAPEDSHLAPCPAALAETAGRQVITFTRFELQPFVLAVDDPSPSQLFVATTRTDIVGITVHSDAFRGGAATLRDDGIAPDSVADDGTFVGTVWAADRTFTPPVPFASTTILRQVTFDLSLRAGGLETVTEDVAYAIGFIDTPEPTLVTRLGPDAYRSEHVVNVVKPNLLLGEYPAIDAALWESASALYEYLEDDYDWIVLVQIYNSFGRPAGSYNAVRNRIEGIGRGVFDNGHLFGSEDRLRGVIQLFFGPLGPLTHEIFHTWGVYSFSAFGLSSVVGGSGHWGPLATPGEDTIFGFPPTLASLSDLGGSLFCGPFANGTSPMGLELYLMGLAPSSAIGRHDFVADATFTGLSTEPGCSYDFFGSGLGTLDASSIEAAFGPRIPAYPDQDQFQIAALVVSNRRLEAIEFDYLGRLLQHHAADFSEDLQGLAEVSYFLPEPSTSLMEASAVLLVLALRRLQRLRTVQSRETDRHGSSRGMVIHSGKALDLV